MTPEMEAAVLKETEDSLREFVQACKNVGLSPATKVLLLHEMSEEVRKSLQ